MRLKLKKDPGSRFCDMLPKGWKMFGVMGLAGGEGKTKKYPAVPFSYEKRRRSRRP